MNIEKLYIGRKKDEIEQKYPLNWINLSKNQKEILVYEVVKDYYRDLKEDVFYSKEEIYTEDMFSLKNMLGLTYNIYVSKFKALQIYYEDKHKLLRLKNVYIGNIGKLYQSESMLENRLLARDRDCIVDLESYDRYCLEDDITIIDAVPYSKVFPEIAHKLTEEKAKILERYHRAF